MLRITGLAAGYGKLVILKGIDLKLSPGDLAVVIGPNGSGKSTTVKSVFGLTTRTEGKIEFQGRDITRLATHERVRLGIGYVPQGRLVFDTLSVEENLEMGAFGMDRAACARRKEELIAIFPALREKLEQKASFLSGGQQQMLSIARALMRSPALLLLDEPSLGLDPKTQKLIFRIIQEINRAGTTVLMVEQNARQALAICTKAYVVENGAIAVVGGPELAYRKKVRELYLGGA